MQSVSEITFSRPKISRTITGRLDQLQPLAQYIPYRFASAFNSSLPYFKTKSNVSFANVV